MARQNYTHSKRQRELLKKQKREEKLQKKLEKKNQPQDGTVDPDIEQQASDDSPADDKQPEPGD